jgi:diaminobutyrate acetyltransferase
MPAANADTPDAQHAPVALRRPTVEDGGEMWRIARDSQVLDLNSSYSYLLWCRDFAATSVVATEDGRPVGFVSGYLRPDDPDTLMVWQVAVDSGQRGRGVAGRMLGDLVDRLPVRHLETTITPDNEASVALFTSFAAARDARVVREPVFDGSLFPDDHETELLFRIGPFT